MEFGLGVNTAPYDPVLHSRSVSNLKEYGSYYQITVSKMINDLEREPMTDFQKSLVADGLSRSEARWFEWCFNNGRLELFGGDYPSTVEKPDHVGRYISNILRARKTLDELGNCNPWEYFVTLTIDPKKFDRFDFKAFYKVFGKFLNHCLRDSGFKMKYVFVPEQHEDGAWHLHGLVMGIPFEVLEPFEIKNFYPFTEVRCPKYILDKRRSGAELFYWSKYQEKFGWCVFERLQSSERASSYITKYIGKGFIGDDRFKNARLILPSQKLQRAVKIKKGFTDMRSVKPSFDCEYAATFKFSKEKYSLSDVLKFFV